MIGRRPTAARRKPAAYQAQTTPVTMFFHVVVEPSQTQVLRVWVRASDPSVVVEHATGWEEFNASLA